MFVQLQLAAQHAPLQHRHVLAAAAAAAAAARGDPSVTAPVSSPCRPASSAARVPPVSSSPSPVSPSPVTAGSFRSHAASAASTACSEVRMEMLPFVFGADCEGSSCSLCIKCSSLILSPMNLYLECRTGVNWAEEWTHHDPTYHLPISQQQMDCSPPASSNATSTPGSSSTPRSRKPGAVIESFVNHAPGVFSGTFSGRCHTTAVISRSRVLGKCLLQQSGT